VPSAEPRSRARFMRELIDELYPLCRSITGDGVRRTLQIIARHAPVDVHEVPSGTPVFDWQVPNEWNIREAWIAGPSGERVVDFRNHNLHVVSYSTPVRRRMSLEELRPHLHTLPEHPDWIPYRTSYYHETWGFCLAQKQLDALEPGEYEVCIDSSLEPGQLTYGECLLPGETDAEILLSVHICHPSLCNDNLSSIALATRLAAERAGRRHRHGLRFLFIPGTIGSITWLAGNPESTTRIRFGLTLTCLGDERPFTYKRTYAGDSATDRAMLHVLRSRGGDHQVIDFSPYGYDERQFNAPGFRLPVGSLMRGRHGRFPEYHTSADDRDFVSAVQLVEAFEVVEEWIEVLEGDARYRNLSPYGEPQLGRRGLYRAMGGMADPEDLQLAMLWVLCVSDGSQSLLDAAERSGLRFATLRAAADLLLEHQLLEVVE
jgi:aminopeptidase-like protein